MAMKDRHVGDLDSTERDTIAHRVVEVFHQHNVTCSACTAYLLYRIADDISQAVWEAAQRGNMDLNTKASGKSKLN